MDKTNRVRVAIGAPPELREWITRTLEEGETFEVVSSTDSGLECLTETARLEPELVILSAELRQLDVVETVWQLKKMHQAPKCLVLSQWVGELPQQAALAGAECCLGIPCTKGAFLQRVGSVMGNCALTQ